MSRHRGSVTKRKAPGTWLIKFDVAPVDGKRKQHYVIFKGTRSDAEKKKTELLALHDEDMLPAKSVDTLATYIEWFLASAHSQSAKTRERYGELAANQIVPHLGEKRLQALKPDDIQQWHRTLIDDGLSPRTIGHAHRLLSLILQSAVINGRLARNVAKLHRPPKVDQEELDILAPDQIATVRAALKGHTLAPLVDVALGTGIRRGELLALQWRDIDLDSGTMRNERAVEETKAGLALKSPKTKRGRRNIRLLAETVETLRANKVVAMQLRLALGAGKLPDDALVFGTWDGKLMRPRNLTKSWARTLASLGLPAVTWHSLRHAHASLLISKGVDILTISRRLGHSKTSVTLDTYGHLMPGGDEAAAKAIEGLLK